MKKIRFNKLSRLKENIVIVVVALVLSFVVVFVSKNNTLFFANVLGVSELPEFSEESDVGVYIDSAGDFNIVSTKNISGVESLSFLILFDPEVVDLTDDAFSSDFSVTYAGAGEGRESLVIVVKGNLEEKKHILKIRVTGDASQIVLGDTIAHFLDDSIEYLSVTLPTKI